MAYGRITPSEYDRQSAIILASTTMTEYEKRGHLEALGLLTDWPEDAERIASAAAAAEDDELGEDWRQLYPPRTAAEAEQRRHRAEAVAASESLSEDEAYRRLFPPGYLED